MGLESHVERVIEEDAPHLRSSFYFAFGRMIVDDADAKEIADVLDMSREFGPASIDDVAGETQINFGIFE